jgi:hypothetical protein
MTLKESEEAIRARHESAMNDGKMRDTPGAVIAATDELTAKLIQQATGKHARKKEKRRAFTDITAAAIVEEKLVKELKNPKD